MRFKKIFNSLIVVLFIGSLITGCKKKDIAERKVDVPKMIEAYEEIGRRHNDFLAKSFIQVKERLARRNVSTRINSMVSPDEVYDVMLEVSSENLIPVVNYPYSSQQLLTELEENLPQELLFQEYTTTQDCLRAVVPEATVSPVFVQALQELDLLLNQCTDYNNVANLIQAFNQLRDKYIPLLTNSAELEAYIAGTTLGKHSLSYWAENETVVIGMFRDMGTFRINEQHGKINAVKADVNGIVSGTLRGIVQGATWGFLLPGIGSVWGAIAFGIVGGALQGCAFSLGAGLLNALILK